MFLPLKIRENLAVSRALAVSDFGVKLHALTNLSHALKWRDGLRCKIDMVKITFSMLKLKHLIPHPFRNS